MFYSLLYANDPALLRHTLKSLNFVARSSCYRLAKQSYIMLKTKQAIANITNLISKQPETEADLFLLWRWAISEIEQTPAFINYEQLASNADRATINGLSLAGVTRSYLPLNETMLIVNQTPDSFSEQGVDYLAKSKTMAKIIAALEAGVSIIDVGAESTRPNASKISAKEEIARLVPLIDELVKLKQRYNFKISLDSYQAPTVMYFLPQIDIINDVSAALSIEVLEQLIQQNKTYLFMHNLTIPANPKVNLALNCNPIDQLLDFATEKMHLLLSRGFNKEQLIFDPGIGFNKTTEQSWYILRNITQLHQLGLELLVGHSRKRFMNKITAKEYQQRDFESAAIAAFLFKQNIDYVRVHGYEQMQTLLMIENQLGIN